MAKKKAKKKKKAAKAKEPLIVASKVKAFVRAHDKNSSKEFLGAVNECVCECIAKAVKRADENKRKTLRPWDL